MLKQIIRDASVPVIVDAGLRSPSEAAQVMEFGGDAVLVNSAIAAAENPELMAGAFAAAVRAGRDARKAGLMPSSETAAATSPLTAFLAGGTGDHACFRLALTRAPGWTSPGEPILAQVEQALRAEEPVFASLRLSFPPPPAAAWKPWPNAHWR